MSEGRAPSQKFAREALALYKTPSTTEASYYPAIKELWTRLLESRGLPFEANSSRSSQKSSGQIRKSWRWPYRSNATTR
jgi:hypothetical protein